MELSIWAAPCKHRCQEPKAYQERVLEWVEGAQTLRVMSWKHQEQPGFWGRDFEALFVFAADQSFYLLPAEEGGSVTTSAQRWCAASQPGRQVLVYGCQKVQRVPRLRIKSVCDATDKQGSTKIYSWHGGMGVSCAT